MSDFMRNLLRILGMFAVLMVHVSVHPQTCGLRNNGATMTDPMSGIEIQKCAVGQSWTGNACTGDIAYQTFDQAVARYGQGAWRLITKEEAELVIPRSKGCDIGDTWTSSRVVGRSHDAWTVAFGSGSVIDFGVGSQDGRVRLVRDRQSSGGAAASANNPQQNPAIQTQSQRTTAPVPPAPYNKPTRDRPDLMGHGCDVGQGSTVKNGCSEIINYVLCIVRHPDGRTTGPDTCQGGQIRPGILLPQDSRQVTSPEGKGSFDYLVAACKHPARPYNVRYTPPQSLSVSCGEF